MLTSNYSNQVLIIGAGIVGLASAYALQKQNHCVTLIDPDNISDRASTAAACLIGGSAVIPWASTNLWREIPSMLLDSSSPLKLSFPFPKDVLSFFVKSHRSGMTAARDESAAGLAELGLTGLNNWMTLLQELPEATALFKQTGCYFLYTEPQHREADQNNCTIRKSFGMTLEEHNESQTQALLPGLICPHASAINVIEAAHVRDPLRLQQLLRIAIESKGGKIVNAKVTGFSTEDSRVKAVLTGSESFEADDIVIAAGYGSKALAGQLGSTIPLLPCRGYSVTLPNAKITIETPLLVLNDGYAITPTDQGLRIAGLVSIGASNANKTRKATELLIARAKTIFGDLDTEGLTTSTGVRPLTPDSLPVIDRSSHFSNLYFNCGHGHWGLTQAASSANLLVEILRSTPSSKTGKYRVNRFI